MKQKRNILIILICGVLTFSACINQGSPPGKHDRVFFPVIEGDCFAMNLSVSFISWLTGSCGNTGQGIPVHHGDLLYITFSRNDDIPLFFRYHENDGERLHFYQEPADEIDYVFYSDKSVVQVNFNGTPGVWQWLEQAQPAELMNIRTLFFPGNSVASETLASRFDLLEKIAVHSNHPGIYLENTRALKDLLTIFQPEWIFIENWDVYEEERGDWDTIFSLLKKQKSCKAVYTGPGSSHGDLVYTFLSSLPGLECILVSPSFINHAAALPLPDAFGNLEEIIVTGQDKEKVTDISFIKKLTSIKKVRFIGTTLSCPGDTSCSIKDLSSLPGLTTLSFTQTLCENIPEIWEIPGIHWFSFPVNTSQSSFSEFCKKNPQIEYMEITGCEDITDVSPVHHLDNVKGLILVAVDIKDYSPLSRLENMEFCVLPSDFFKEERRAEREELEKKLTNTTLVCGEPFCLGSGWIILFPLCVVLAFLFIIVFQSLGRRVHYSSQDPPDYRYNADRT